MNTIEKLEKRINVFKQSIVDAEKNHKDFIVKINKDIDLTRELLTKEKLNCAPKDWELWYTDPGAPTIFLFLIQDNGRSYRCLHWDVKDTNRPIEMMPTLAKKYASSLGEAIAKARKSGHEIAFVD